MSNVPGSVPVGGFIAPTAESDTYATHDERFGAGGYRSVADSAARNAITAARRVQGMLVTTLDDDLTWQLNAAPWIGNDTDWHEYTTTPANAFPYIPPIAFAHGDAAGIRWTAPADGTITVTRVDIDTTFNGTTPTIKVGTMGSIEALMSAAQNDPTANESFEVASDLAITSGTGVWLEVSAGGASQGAGRLFLHFIPAS